MAMTPLPGPPVRPIVRVLLVDDHRMFTQALEGLLAGEAGIEPVGVAGSVDEALAQLDDVQPDVVLMDLDLPGANGIEGTREVRRRRPDTAVVIVTSHDDPDLIIAAIRAGACGYVLKTRAVDELVSIIRQAAAGGMILSPAGVPQAIGAARRPRTGRDRAPDDAQPLTDREMDVLRHLASGRSTEQIADSLYISVLTVRSHVKSILAKLGVHSKLEAVTYALHLGLIEVSRPA
jgi:NarL family two-component system response regulator LiaR